MWELLRSLPLSSSLTLALVPVLLPVLLLIKWMQLHTSKTHPLQHSPAGRFNHHLAFDPNGHSLFTVTYNAAQERQQNG
jgi:hypothetical protein